MTGLEKLNLSFLTFLPTPSIPSDQSGESRFLSAVQYLTSLHGKVLKVRGAPCSGAVL